MPIKLPRSLARRKSSGNALEELENPPEPSFRVFERPSNKSFDGGNSLKRMSSARPLSAGQLENQIYVDGKSNINSSNRGSGGTNNSASSGHDNSSLSARYSSTSTLPSSTDSPIDERHSPHPKDTHNIPLPAVPGSTPRSFRTGGRTFSFGRKKVPTSSGTPPPPPPPKPSDSPGYAHVTRERALTESSYASGSTATPPKFLDGGLDFESSELDGFGSMFENVGKRRSQTANDTMALGIRATESPENISPGGPRMLTKSYFGERPLNTPSPIHIDRTREIESSPYTSSHHSQEGLISSRSPAPTDLSFDREDYAQTSRYRDPVHPHTTPLPNANTSPNRIRQPRPALETGLRRTSAYTANRASTPSIDDDARLVMESVHASRKLSSRRSGMYDSYIDSYRDSYHYEEGRSDGQPLRSPAESPLCSDFPSTNTTSKSFTKPENKTPVELFDGAASNGSSSRWRMESTETTPRAKKLNMATPEDERPLFEISPLPSAKLPPQPSKNLQKLANANGQNKVMTPAQFEKYRREQEKQQRNSMASKSDGSDDESDDYDDEDEAERSKELAKQRRKQEAHLAVYRQQMMKVTGEQPSDLPDLPKAQSTPALPGRSMTPTFSFDKPPGSKNSDDEDDEVPLGILAAHGFPGKNRPPTIGMNNPTIKYQSESYPPPPMSSAGASTAGGPRGLPPFAKHLPPDPYFGAGLVNSSTRESIGMGHGGPASSYGGSQQGVHPAGLVGIIAGEERAKAARRGSPNAQGGWSQPLPQGMPHTMGMPAPMTPGDEAQIHMSQQMTQMMQMQMQWMQQMQHMMANGMQPPMMPGQPPFPPQHMQQGMPGFLSPQPSPHMSMASGMLTPGSMPRPVSHSAPSSPAAVQNQQRAMSMMNPTLTPGWQTRKSVAPSMMSGALGQQLPHSYAPSLAPSERSTVGMPSRYRPVSIPPIDEGSRPGSSMGLSAAGTEKRNGTQKSTLNAVRRVPSDDDDDKGWEEMKAKREQKKSGWRFKKERKDDSLQGIYFDG